MASQLEVHRVTFNIEDMLDWRWSARTLRQAATERAVGAVPERVWFEHLEPPEPKLEVDGQHVIVKFLVPQAEQP